MLLMTAGCSSSSGSSTVTPMTAIVVPADAVTRDRGCGPEPGKIFKYAAVLSTPGSVDAGDNVQRGLARGVYDCYVDATFKMILGDDAGFDDIPISRDGSTPFQIEIVAFDAAEYEAQKDVLDALANPTAVLDLSAFDKLRGALFQCDATFRFDVASTAQCQSRGRR